MKSEHTVKSIPAAPSAERPQQDQPVRDAEGLLGPINESIPALFSRVDRDLRYVFVNTVHERVTGITSASIGRRVPDVVSDEVYKRIEPYVKQVLTGKPVTCEHWFKAPVGRLMYMLSCLVPEVNTAGTVTGFAALEIDITARQRAYDVLRRNEERYRTLVENANDMIQKVDREGRFLFVNRAWQEKLGYTPDDLSRLTAFDIIAPASLAHCRAVFVEVFEGKTVADFEVLFVAKDGKRIVAEGSVAPRWGDGQVVATHGYFRDITDRKRIEVENRLHRERLEAAEAHAGLGSWEINVGTETGWWSAEMYQLLGFDPAHGMPSLDDYLNHIHPADRQLVRDAFLMLAQGKEPPGGEFRTNPEFGTLRVLSPTFRVDRDQSGNAVKAAGTLLNVTQRKQLEAQFLQAQKMESVGQLAGGVAHDFNNLLTVINGTAELAAAQLHTGDPLEKDLTEIRAAGVRAAALTRQLLAFSRKQILQPQVVNLNTVVEDVRSMLRRLIDEDVELQATLADDLGNVRIDPGQIDQVILNLAVNARDAMPNGGTLTIATRNIELDDAHFAAQLGIDLGSYVMLAISDTGVGIDEATRLRVFEPFFTTKAPGSGTGLGLATVHGIVKQSGGGIALDSEVGKGTTFTIYLPRVAEAAREGRPAQTAALARGTETILVVEDQEALRRVAQRILASAGYTVLTAANGERALELLEHHHGPVHLVVTDVVMPGMSGFDLAARLADIRPMVKLLYTSGYSHGEIARRRVRDEGMHFLGKPYTIHELSRRVRDVLDS